MKKTVLAILGVGGACAACCAVPILLPLISGTLIAGAAGLASGQTVLVAAGAAGAAALGVAALWFMRRPRQAESCATSETGTAEAEGPGCGCGPSKACGTAR